MTLVWYFDKTRKGSDPEKWRDQSYWELYSERNQRALNMATEAGTSKLHIVYEKWQSKVLVDLQKLEQYDDDDTVRHEVS